MQTASRFFAARDKRLIEFGTLVEAREFARKRGDASELWDVLAMIGGDIVRVFPLSAGGCDAPHC